MAMVGKRVHRRSAETDTRKKLKGLYREWLAAQCAC